MPEKGNDIFSFQEYQREMQGISMRHRKRSNPKNILRALHHRNYRLFFSGQCISLMGTWMQRIAMGWLVYRLTNSPFLLGLVGFAGQIPLFLLPPFTGVFADRWNRHRILMITQSLAMLQALALAFLVLAGVVAIWHLLCLSALLGLIEAFDMPARQSFVVEMIEDREDLGNAIALNSSIVNGARLIGPSIAGILIAGVGEGVCFLLNGVSYIAVLAALRAMKFQPRKKEKREIHIFKGLEEGFRYAFGFIPIRNTLLLITVVSLVGMPYAVLMPVFARDILHGDSHTLGFLMGGSGVGALLGAVYLASRKGILGLERWNALAAGVFGAGLIVFAFSRHFFLSLPLMLLIGFGMLIQHAASNTLIQTVVDEDKRGRVMSFYAMAFRGTAPFGSLMAGSLASKLGAPAVLVIGGALCIVASLLFTGRLREMRSIMEPLPGKEEGS